MANMPEEKYGKSNDLLHVDSSFTDYTKFEVDSRLRSDQKLKFINDEIWVPDYKYDKLDFLNDYNPDNNVGRMSVVAAKKLTLQYSVMELDSLKKSGHISEQLAEIYADYYELRLKRIMLVEAARDLRKNSNSTNQESLRRSFAELNRELYGDFDTKDFMGILNTELSNLQALDKSDYLTRMIADELLIFFNGLPAERYESEQKVLKNYLIEKLLPVVSESYEYIWEAVPNTQDDVCYSASECSKIINKSLKYGGLYDKGWRANVDSNKKAPSTSSESKKISLPNTLSRNASQLRALIIHEQGIHAVRAQNGEESGLLILKSGTAKYASTEEGLGVLLECIVNGSTDNPAYHRARDRYITTGLAFGADGGLPRDARQTYEILWRIISSRKASRGTISLENINQSKDEAYDHIENAFRGTNFAMPGLIYSKLKIYREGLIKNVGYFNDNIDDVSEALRRALMGKYNHTDKHEYNLLRNLILTKRH